MNSEMDGWTLKAQQCKWGLSKRVNKSLGRDKQKHKSKTPIIRSLSQTGGKTTLTMARNRMSREKEVKKVKRN